MTRQTINLSSICRTSPAEFIVLVDQFLESLKNTYSIGMRFKMRVVKIDKLSEKFIPHEVAMIAQRIIRQINYVAKASRSHGAFIPDSSVLTKEGSTKVTTADPPKNEWVFEGLARSRALNLERPHPVRTMSPKLLTWAVAWFSSRRMGRLICGKTSNGKLNMHSWSMMPSSPSVNMVDSSMRRPHAGEISYQNQGQTTPSHGNYMSETEEHNDPVVPPQKALESTNPRAIKGLKVDRSRLFGEFCSMVRKIFIYTREEVQKMNPGALNSRVDENPVIAEERIGDKETISMPVPSELVPNLLSFSYMASLVSELLGSFSYRRYL
ncbi:hypothetical protein IFM89_033847 [Coptis chinensis]|uniref:Uncharacterized protein n=1 Tax=Coptis chinensis TaxID=261450 RepID=A0A835I056_9MAGN|nr:hypothetical protein IFM89_033847 [Coptis chinensis]